MDVLTDAEYSRLTPIEKAQYWANRCQDVEEKYEELRVEHLWLRRVLSNIHDASNGHNFTQG